jgi:nicotinamide-nucleotide amidase
MTPFNTFSQNYLQLATEIGEALKQRKLKLVTAESCTGGFVAQVITSVAGSSEWFERGFITYSNEAKIEMLRVSSQTLQFHGAVSEEVAQEMAQGALKNSHAQVSVSVTGIAGPSGGTPQKPVGTCCFAWSGLELKTQAKSKIFSGDRATIRLQAVEFVLTNLYALLKNEDI